MRDRPIWPTPWDTYVVYKDLLSNNCPTENWTYDFDSNTNCWIKRLLLGQKLELQVRMQLFLLKSITNQLSWSNSILQDPLECRRLIGRLIYLNNARPIISNVIQKLSQYVSCSNDIHKQVIYRILRYIKSTLGKSIQAFNESDWIGYKNFMQSTTGYLICIGSSCWTKWCSSFEESKPFEGCWSLGWACCCCAVLVRIWGRLCM